MKQNIESNDNLVVLTISDGKNKRYLVVAREELEKPLEQKNRGVFRVYRIKGMAASKG